MLKNLSMMKIALITLLISFGLTTAHATKLAVQRYNNIPYVSGGVGDQEQAAFKEMADDFNLNLVFAVKESGSYLSDVVVRIYDSQGNLTLDAMSTGPMFYTNLPPGQYKVEVSGFGESYEQAIQVGQSNQKPLIFTWPREKVMR